MNKKEITEASAESQDENVVVRPLRRQIFQARLPNARRSLQTPVCRERKEPRDRCDREDGERKYRVYADNRAYFYALPRIECRRQIVSARSVTKYGGFRIPVRGSQMTLRIPNRGMEVVETEFS